MATVTVTLRAGEAQPADVRLYALDVAAAVPLVVYLFTAPANDVVLRDPTAAPGGGSVDLVSVQTLDDVAGSAAAAVAVKAAASATLDDVAPSATVAVAVAAASSAQLDDVAGAATAAVAVQGAASATLDDVAATAAAAALVQVAAAATLDDVAGVATGTVAVQAAASATLDDVTPAAAAVVAVKASASASLDDISGTATATVAGDEDELVATETVAPLVTVVQTVQPLLLITRSSPLITRIVRGTAVVFRTTYDKDGPIDPAALMFRLVSPTASGGQITRQYVEGVDEEIVRESEGIFSVTLIVDWVGTAKYSWRSTAPDEESVQDGTVIGLARLT